MNCSALPLLTTLFGATPVHVSLPRFVIVHFQTPAGAPAAEYVTVGVVPFVTVVGPRTVVPLGLASEYATPVPLDVPASPAYFATCEKANESCVDVPVGATVEVGVENEYDVPPLPVAEQVVPSVVNSEPVELSDCEVSVEPEPRHVSSWLHDGSGLPVPHGLPVCVTLPVKSGQEMIRCGRFVQFAGVAPDHENVPGTAAHNADHDVN